jgi:hypothetical protein
MAKTTGQRASDMNSVSNGGSSINDVPSSVSLPPMAGAPAAMNAPDSMAAYAPAPSLPGAAPDSQYEIHNGSTRPTSAFRSASAGAVGSANQLSPSTSAADARAKLAETATAGDGTVNLTGASSPRAASLRDTLRNRMGRAGASASTSASDGGGGTALSTAAVKDRKTARATGGSVEAGLHEEFSAESGRMPPMAMQNSETASAVRELVDDFERSLGADRSPASVQAQDADVILSSESPSLFLRLREVHERCLKRACVITSGKGKI